MEKNETEITGDDKQFLDFGFKQPQLKNLEYEYESKTNDLYYCFSFPQPPV